ncbi:MAG: hypothetical protein WBD22_06645 [Pyrinomonadaceae bacterium]
MTESELLTLFLENPIEYGGNLSVIRINAFFNGYRETIKMERDPIYEGYSEWLRNRLRISQDVNWLSIICFFGQGEADTLDLAREMWAKYLKEMNGEKKPRANNKTGLSSLGRNKPSELMDHIFARPEMYGGGGYPSVSLIQSFMDGSIFAKKNEKSEIDDALYYGFHDWLVKRFGFGQSHDWGSIISFMGRSEANSVDMAKELWQEYKEKATVE